MPMYENLPQQLRIVLPTGPVVLDLNPRPVATEWSVIGATTAATIRLPSDGEASSRDKRLLKRYLGLAREPVSITRARGRLDHYRTDSDPPWFVDPRYVAIVEHFFPDAIWHRITAGSKRSDIETRSLVATSNGEPVAIVACLHTALARPVAAP